MRARKNQTRDYSTPADDVPFGAAAPRWPQGGDPGLEPPITCLQRRWPGLADLRLRGKHEPPHPLDRWHPLRRVPAAPRSVLGHLVVPL